MNGFRVECQQLGTARTETVARPGECRRIGHATKLHSLKSHNTVTVGTFETKVRPLRGFRALPLGGGGGGYHGGGVGGGGTDTRHETIYTLHPSPNPISPSYISQAGSPRECSPDLPFLARSQVSALRAQMQRFKKRAEASWF